MAPTVTVILTCYRHEAFVTEALDAVEAQTHRPIQLVVTDDASDDGSAERIADWLSSRWPDAAFVRNERNVGLCRTLNEALELATGDLVVITSADDWMEPERLARQVAAFESSPPTVGLVYGGLRLVDAAGAELARYHVEPGASPSGWIFPELLAAPVLPTTTVMVRRSVYDAVGGFVPDDVVEDYDMWLRICRDHEVRHVPEVLANFRWHDANTTTRIHGPVYDGYVAACLRRQLGYSPETDEIIAAHLAKLGR